MDLVPDTVRSFMSPREFRELVGASRAAVYRWIQSGELGAVRLGKRGTLRIPRAEVEWFLQQRRVVSERRAPRSSCESVS